MVAHTLHSFLKLNKCMNLTASTDKPKDIKMKGPMAVVQGALPVTSTCSMLVFSGYLSCFTPNFHISGPLFLQTKNDATQLNFPAAMQLFFLTPE